MKKIPYGKTDFKGLIIQDCYYVDKTIKYIKKSGKVANGNIKAR